MTVELSYQVQNPVSKPIRHQCIKITLLLNSELNVQSCNCKTLGAVRIANSQTNKVVQELKKLSRHLECSFGKFVFFNLQDMNSIKLIYRLFDF